jgi:acyl-ACP thioesterase
LEIFFEKQFELRYFEMNKFGEASPTTILTLLEETAAEHCYSINYSLYDLERQNIGWVLLSGVMDIYRYPNYKEKIIIRTWLSNYSAIKGFRENIIYDERRNIIGKARGLWVFFDIERRRPARIFDDIIEKWSFYNEECIDYDITKKIEAIDSGSYVNEFKVNRFDTDTNQHVNNLRYLQWLIETIPTEIIDNYYIKSIDGQYGDTIMAITNRDIIDNAFIHTIKTQNNKICATARTNWRERIK